MSFDDLGWPLIAISSNYLGLGHKNKNDGAVRRWKNFNNIFNRLDKIPRLTDRRTDGRNCYIDIACCSHEWTRTRDTHYVYILQSLQHTARKHTACRIYVYVSLAGSETVSAVVGKNSYCERKINEIKLATEGDRGWGSCRGGGGGTVRVLASPSLVSSLAGTTTRMRLTAVQYVMQTKLPNDQAI